MYKQPIILIGFFLLIILVVMSLKKNKPKENLLWEITSPYSKNKSYLFGTIHLIEKEFFSLPKSLIKKIKNSSTVIFETPYPTNSNVRELMLLPEGGNILTFFSESEKKKIINWSEKNLKINENEFQESYGKYKLFVLNQTITQLPYLDNSVSYEQEIYKTIKSSQKKIEGLETIEEQIKLLDEIPIENQKKQIIYAIDSLVNNQRILREMQLAYKKQDLQVIYKWIEKESANSEVSLDLFLEKRNLKWLPKIINEINKKSTFIAVGAGHLAGEKGLINLLRKNGFKLKSIYIK